MDTSLDIRLADEQRRAEREALLNDALYERWLDNRDSDDADAMNGQAVANGEAPWIFASKQ